MDKSRRYIAMCECAREIQGCWAQQYGDFYVNDDLGIACWLGKKESPVKMKCGFCITSQGKIIRLAKYVWLPRLDQLIEMAQIRGRRYESTTQDFFDWAKVSYGSICEKPGNLFKSLEQLWLAFVMEQKFNKQWNGKIWVQKGT